MSKKKSKSAAKKTAPRPAARTAAPNPESTERTRTSYATIFIFKTGTGTKIRTAPQRLFAGPGAIEWTVVNLVDGSNVPVTLSWPNGGPWGKEPLDIRDGMVIRSLDDARKGRYKYVVRALDATEDPEVEIPEM
jgi:hypothetical protein